MRFTSLAHRALAMLVVCSLALVSFGCGGAAKKTDKTEGETTSAKDGAAKDAGSDDASSNTVRTVSAENLPGLAEALPVLDNGRVHNLCPPAGWKRRPRDSAYLAAFIVDGAHPNDMPRILVRVADAPQEWPRDTTADNITELTELVAAEHAESKVLLEKPVSLVIGANPFTRYVLLAKQDGAPIEQQILETVHDGRRYTLVLQVRQNDIRKHRDKAYAVAAGIEFKAATASPTPPPTTTDGVEKKEADGDKKDAEKSE